MSGDKYFIDIMQSRDVKPTAVRLLVLRAMSRGGEMVTMGDLVRLLRTVDKSSISRTLSLFMRKGIVHAADDGSGALKYNLSIGVNMPADEGSHIHFSCERCQRTFCLPAIGIPQVYLPEGFRTSSVNFVIKGLCPACSEAASRQK
ncbi:MAG: transcriptional repressor [Prevotella sp.]|nr:transcriptional repressor [Prevotella sp.]MBQ8628058.1 transcriptional repressor [Prevotella sp.]